MTREQKKPPARLGDLEAEVMAVVWEKGEATVQEVKDSLESGRSPAYTTVMTVMSRLAEKGILERHKEGRAYLYRPATAQEKLAGSMLRALIGRLYGGSSAHAIAHLIEADGGVDDAELARLEKLIQRKRTRS